MNHPKFFSPTVRALIAPVGLALLLSAIAPATYAATPAGPAPTSPVAVPAPSVPSESPKATAPPAPAATPAPAAPAVAGPQAIAVGPYDTLHIEMAGQPDLSRDYVVDSSGDIQVPYIGKVHVGGLTVDQAEVVVTARFKKIYHDVSLNLTRTGLGGISVTVTGAVGRVGPVSVRRDSHLNDVIQQLGPLPDADLNHVQVSHAPGATDPSAIVNLGTYLETGNSVGNPIMHDGDVVFVSAKPKASAQTIAISVVGSVPHPGRFDVAPGTTAYDAITMAGGLSPTSDSNGLYIQPMGQTAHTSLDWTKLSQTPGSPDVNPILHDGDKIVIPELAIASTFSIMGAVRTPNTYPLRGSMSLLDALSVAGGYDQNAKPGETTITRTTPQGATTIKVDAGDPNKAATFMVQPNDHIIVPQGGAKGGGTKIDPLAAIGLLVTIFAVLHH